MYMYVYIHTHTHTHTHISFLKTDTKFFERKMNKISKANLATY